MKPYEHAFALTIAQACHFTGLSRTTLYKLVKIGRLPLRKVAGRSLILRDDLVSMLQGSQAR